MCIIPYLQHREFGQCFPMNTKVRLGIYQIYPKQNMFKKREIFHLVPVLIFIKEILHGKEPRTRGPEIQSQVRSGPPPKKEDQTSSLLGFLKSDIIQYLERINQI